MIGDGSLAQTRQLLERTLTRWLVDTTDVIGWDLDSRFPSVPDGYRT